MHVYSCCRHQSDILILPATMLWGSVSVAELAAHQTLMLGIMGSVFVRLYVCMSVPLSVSMSMSWCLRQQKNTFAPN